MLCGQVELMLSRHAIMTFGNGLQRSILQPSWDGGLGNSSACMCLPAATQLFPARAVSSQKRPPLGTTCLLWLTPDPASRPHARRLMPQIREPDDKHHS